MAIGEHLNWLPTCNCSTLPEQAVTEHLLQLQGSAFVGQCSSLIVQGTDCAGPVVRSRQRPQLTDTMAIWHAAHCKVPGDQPQGDAGRVGSLKL